MSIPLQSHKKEETMLPLVSVIIPAHNREDFIKQTIDSVIQQTYPNIELIVVDDGSTDKTYEILKQFGDKIFLLQHQGGTNKGQSAAINLGMRTANGKYIAVLDSDDLFQPNKITLQVDFLERNHDIGLVYGNGQAIDEKGNYLYDIIPPGHTERNKPELVLLNCYYNVPSNALVRKRAFADAGEFDESMRSAQDHDMAIRLAEVCKLAYLNENLWYYRRHPGTQSGQHAKRRWLIGFVILKNACKRFNYPKSIKRKRLAVLNFRLGQCYLEEKKYIKALYRLCLSVFFDPIRAIQVLVGKEQITGHH